MDLSSLSEFRKKESLKPQKKSEENIQLIGNLINFYIFTKCF